MAGRLRWLAYASSWFSASSDCFRTTGSSESTLIYGESLPTIKLFQSEKKKKEKIKKSTYFSVNKIAIIIIIPFGQWYISSSGLLKYDVSINVDSSLLDSDTM